MSLLLSSPLSLLSIHKTMTLVPKIFKLEPNEIQPKLKLGCVLKSAVAGSLKSGWYF